MKTYIGDTNNLSKVAKKIYVGYNNKALTLPIVETGDKRIFGAVWDGSADTFWTRTDDSVGWIDPNPYYAGMTGTPSSPCDDIMPWAGMVKSENEQAGTVVAIPKFYVKIGYANPILQTGLKIQIAPGSNGDAWALSNGFICSPAHMNRGDGAGERDVVYVGRYHCASDYKSKTGVKPKVSTNRPTFRSGIHALNNNVWMMDFATYMTIAMLYLVEFADWNSQGKIGGGCSATESTSSAVYNMGGTDNMPYHTGTVSSSIGATVYGNNQYRYIEGLWANCFDWIDGAYANGLDIYAIINPSAFSDSTGGTKVCTKPSSSGYASAYYISAATGFEWFFFPSAVAGSDSTYACDVFGGSSGSAAVFIGGTCVQGQARGLFCLYASIAASFSDAVTGSRLMVLP